MKYERKCPCCHRRATKRIGRVDFCEECAKEVRRNGSKYVLSDVLGGSFGGISVYGYKQVKIK